jgi:hypothetical protein
VHLVVSRVTYPGAETRLGGCVPCSLALSSLCMVDCDPCAQWACRHGWDRESKARIGITLAGQKSAGDVVLGYERDSSLQLTSRATVHSGLACQGPFVIISTTHSSLRTVRSSPWPEFADVCRASVLLGRSKLRGATWRGCYIRSGGWQ